MAPLSRTPSKVFFLSLFLVLAATLKVSLSAADGPKMAPSNVKSPTVQKSKINTNIYEKSDEAMRFSDIVKLVRETDDGTQVMFMKMPGFFGAPPDSTSMAHLIESQKRKSIVQITADENSRRINSVHIGTSPSDSPPAGQ